MSKVQGGMKCVKYLLFFFNFIFWVSAFACFPSQLQLVEGAESSLKEIKINKSLDGYDRRGIATRRVCYSKNNCNIRIILNN